MRRLAAALFLAAVPAALAADADDLLSPDEQTRARVLKKLAGSEKIDPALTATLVDRLREDPSPAVRRDAAWALRNVQPPQKLALAALAEVAADADELPAVREAAVGSLGQIGKRSKRVAAALERAAGDPHLTANALRALVDIGFPDRVRPLLDHRDEKVRAEAAGAYLASGGRDAFLFALSSEHPDVRRVAVAGLKARDYRSAPLEREELDAVVKAAADPDAGVRASVAEGLKAAGKASLAIPALVEGLKSEDERVRWTSAEALSGAGPGVAKYLPEIVKAIDGIRDDKDGERAKFALILALAEAGADARPVLPKLYALLKDKKPYTRRTALEALAKVGAADSAETVKQARALADDPDPEVRRLVTRVVTAAATKADELRELLRSPDVRVAYGALPLVRRLGNDAAVLVPDMLALVARQPKSRPGFGSPLGDIKHALSALGPKAVPAIMAGFDSPDEKVRDVCGESLKWMGFDAAGAVPELRKGLAHKDSLARSACAEALGNLGYHAREAIPDLVKAIAAHEDLAASAGPAIAWIGGVTGDDAKRLIELARAPRAANRRSGYVAALGGIGKDANPVLEEIERELPAGEKDVRWGVTEARKWIEPGKVLAEQLPKILTDPDPTGPARIALRIEPTAEQKKVLVANIARRLDNRSPPIQVYLLQCLGCVGPDASAALPGIEKLLSSADERVRVAATRAVKQIRP